MHHTLPSSNTQATIWLLCRHLPSCLEKCTKHTPAYVLHALLLSTYKQRNPCSTEQNTTKTTAARLHPITWTWPKLLHKNAKTNKQNHGNYWTLQKRHLMRIHLSPHSKIQWELHQTTLHSQQTLATKTCLQFHWISSQLLCTKTTTREQKIPTKIPTKHQPTAKILAPKTYQPPRVSNPSSRQEHGSLHPQPQYVHQTNTSRTPRR